MRNTGFENVLFFAGDTSHPRKNSVTPKVFPSKYTESRESAIYETNVFVSFVFPLIIKYIVDGFTAGM